MSVDVGGAGVSVALGIAVSVGGMGVGEVVGASGVRKTASGVWVALWGSPAGGVEVGK